MFAFPKLYAAVFTEPDGPQQLTETYHFSQLQVSTTLLILTFYQRNKLIAITKNIFKYQFTIDDIKSAFLCYYKANL